jgi:hypothetical protein
MDGGLRAVARRRHQGVNRVPRSAEEAFSNAAARDEPRRERALHTGAFFLDMSERE